jgi:hypothetical protein
MFFHLKVGSELIGNCSSRSPGVSVRTLPTPRLDSPQRGIRQWSDFVIVVYIYRLMRISNLNASQIGVQAVVYCCVDDNLFIRYVVNCTTMLQNLQMISP